MSRNQAVAAKNQLLISCRIVFPRLVLEFVVVRESFFPAETTAGQGQDGWAPSEPQSHLPSPVPNGRTV